MQGARAWAEDAAGSTTTGREVGGSCCLSVTQLLPTPPGPLPLQVPPEGGLPPD